jgi:hypothetical protein
MVLLNPVVQVFALPQFGFQCLLLLQLIPCNWISGVFINRDDSWNLSVLRSQHLTEEAGGRLSISLRTQHEVQGIARSIHRSAQVFPLPTDLDVRLVDSPQTIRWVQERANALDQSGADFSIQ